MEREDQRLRSYRYTAQYLWPTPRNRQNIILCTCTSKYLYFHVLCVIDTFVIVCDGRPGFNL